MCIATLGPTPCVLSYRKSSELNRTSLVYASMVFIPSLVMLYGNKESAKILITILEIVPRTFPFSTTVLLFSSKNFRERMLFDDSY